MDITSIRIRGRKPSPGQLQDLMIELKSALIKKGYSNWVDKTSGQGLNIRDIRLSQKYVDKYGYNLSPWTGRRGRILGWKNWVSVNNTINKVLDREGVSANVKSLGGKFKIRKGKLSYTEQKWLNEAGYDNVGSVMNPVDRVDAWLPEGKSAKRSKLRKMM